MLFVGIVLCVACGTLVPNLLAQNTDTFQITQVLQNDGDTSIIAFSIYGTFEENDVVNLYSNDVFIKAKPINTPELARTREITLENISIDAFEKGENQIVAKIERNGEEVAETPVFQLTIQQAPNKPTILVLVDREQGLVAVDISSDFERGDSVRLLLNGIRTRERGVTSDELILNTVRIAGISMDSLRIGENYFEATVVREGHESERSDQSERITVEEVTIEEMLAEEAVTETPIAEETAVAEQLQQQCVAYSEPEKITALAAETYEGFGAVIDVKNNVFVAGTNTEGVYIHRKSGQGWLYPIKILERDAGTRTSAGKEVLVLDENTVLAGDPGAWHNGERSSGAVYAYKRYGLLWNKYATIAPQEPTYFEEFGSKIALEGNTLAVSARRHNRSGAVYVYKKIGNAWIQSARLIPQDTKADQNFGYSISVDKGRVAISAPGDGDGGNGAVYVYTQGAGGWVAEKITQQNRRSNAHFGKEVLLRGDMLLVSADHDEDRRRSAEGVVYVYVRQTDGWYLAQKLYSLEDDDKSDFGAALAYSNDGTILAVGAPESDSKRSVAGAVYLFRRSNEAGALWELREVLTPQTLGRGDRFGSSIDFDGKHLFVGAYGTDTNKRNVGAVYLFNAAMIPCQQELQEAEQHLPAAVSESSSEVFIDRTHEQEDLLETLKEKKGLIDQLAENVATLAELLGGGIENVYNDITKKRENIVIYDESVAHELAQKRAAERRGVIGPQIPGEVAIIYVESEDEIPAPPTEETVRSRDSVIRETENKVGVVVPVTTKDLRFGDVHEEVLRLQVFLNRNGYRVAESGPGSPGNETSTFTKETDRALRSFQLVNGLRVTGVLNKETRDVILTFISRTGT